MDRRSALKLLGAGLVFPSFDTVIKAAGSGLVEAKFKTELSKASEIIYRSKSPIVFVPPKPCLIRKLSNANEMSWDNWVIKLEQPSVLRNFLVGKRQAKTWIPYNHTRFIAKKDPVYCNIDRYQHGWGEVLIEESDIFYADNRQSCGYPTQFAFRATPNTKFIESEDLYEQQEKLIFNHYKPNVNFEIKIYLHKFENLSFENWRQSYFLMEMRKLNSSYVLTKSYKVCYQDGNSKSWEEACFEERTQKMVTEAVRYCENEDSRIID